MASVLIRDTPGRDPQRREEGRMKTEAEIRLMQPQTKEGVEPPGTGSGEGGFSFRAFGGSTALPTP